MIKVDPNLNDSFFRGLYKDVWRKLVPAGLTEAEVDFIEEVTHLEPGQKVLDVMCGYGRHSLALAKKGYVVTAVDNLKEYVLEINESAQAHSLPVCSIQSNVLELQLTQSFDAIICMGNSFSFFNEQEAISVLENLSKHLKPGDNI